MAQKVYKSPLEQSESLQKKSVGEDLTDFYNKQFFKQANGDRNAFIEHNISRFGIPRGSSKAKEVEHYGQVFDKLAQNDSKANYQSILKKAFNSLDKNDAFKEIQKNPEVYKAFQKVQRENPDGSFWYLLNLLPDEL